MVFRGKPSKACERCRARRLKCDLQLNACGQCVRATVNCSGYRDTGQLRIRNESDSVARKVLKAPSVVQSVARKAGKALYVLPSINPCVDLKSASRLCAYYIPTTSMYWGFFKQYYRQPEHPDHLKLAAEAVSLAYIWHQVHSDAILATARAKYCSALRMTNKALESPKEATKDTTLLVALLLDLFEKITGSQPQRKSWTSHVDGALSLVRLRGIEEFQDPLSFRILVRISSNHVISCIASATPVQDDLVAIRNFAGTHLDLQDPNWRMLDLMVSYANLRSAIREGTFSKDERVGASMELDLKLQALDLDLPPSWQYKSSYVEYESSITFDLPYDIYPDRNVSQGRNNLRIIRILLNEFLLEHYTAPSTEGEKCRLIETAHESIEKMAAEICACVPQYLCCESSARHDFAASEQPDLLEANSNHTLNLGHREKSHSHTPTDRLECYTMVFPIYVVGRSKAVPHIRPWAIKQLQYIGSHFDIRAAGMVAELLEQKAEVEPWEVSSMLGSYAFAA